MNLPIKIRIGLPQDLFQIVRLLADDPLGLSREVADQDALPKTYHCAFHAILRDPNNNIVVAELADEILGVLQITFIPTLTHQGSWRAQIEGVRVASSHRRQGVGTQLVAWATELAREKNCRLVQLTMDRRREPVGNFYRRLGFIATHEGFKKELDSQDEIGGE